MTQFTCKGVKQINNRISLNMTFTFTIRISRCFSSAQEFQMGNCPKNVGQDFIVLDFFHGRKILKVDGRDGRDPQNREKNAPAGRFTCMHTQVRFDKISISFCEMYKQTKNTLVHKVTMTCLYLPLFSALNFIETTSDPDPASLIANAPTYSPDIN